MADGDAKLERWKAFRIEGRHESVGDSYLRETISRMGRLEASNATLLEALKECADDLESEVEHRYKDTKDYPSERRRYERDIAPVRKARAAIVAAMVEK